MASHLVLASRSPQRRAILEQLGIDFEVAVPEVEEAAEGDPGSLVVENALRKARSVPATSAAVLGVDTLVALGARTLGKPRDEGEAREFLTALSGREHEVHSGLALLAPQGQRVERATTRVRFRALEQAQLDWYLASGEWRERAGGYAIQARGAALVERIEGDYSNVVGLPVSLLVRMAPWLLVD